MSSSSSSASASSSSVPAASDAQIADAFARLNALDRDRIGTWVNYLDHLDNSQYEQELLRPDPYQHPLPYSLTHSRLKQAQDSHAKNKKSDNRYSDISSWDHALLPGPYLNASYISAFPSSSQTYIASQAPLSHTIPTFLAHLCAQGVKALVMLTPLTEQGKKKAEPYWPQHGHAHHHHHHQGGLASHLSNMLHRDQHQGQHAAATQSYGHHGWAVELLEEHELHAGPPQRATSSSTNQQPLPHGTRLTLRRLRIHLGSQPTKAQCETSSSGTSASTSSHASYHDVTQLHLASWPDFGTDSIDTLDSLLDWIDHAQQEAQDNGQSSSPLPPIWIHCSAGVGRSGTVIASHILRHHPQASLSSSSTPQSQLFDAAVPDREARNFLLPALAAGGENRTIDPTLVDCVATVAYLRHFRPSMVQAQQQLAMLYQHVRRQQERRQGKPGSG
ncbi:tyrosine protein phosphatase 1 [Tilletia horrida]|nr:tyrosine protein phosphatase 1 [Tilletia horrida]